MMPQILLFLLSLYVLSFLYPASAMSEMPPGASVPSNGGPTPVTVVTVSGVPTSVTQVQTVPMMPQSLQAGMPHTMPQPTATVSAFPPVMVPPFRLPMPGMHIPLPGIQTIFFFFLLLLFTCYGWDVCLCGLCSSRARHLKVVSRLSSKTQTFGCQN